MDFDEELLIEPATNTTGTPGITQIHSLESIIYLLWAIICIIPNALLNYLIIRNNIYKNNFYFIIFHFSVSNVLLLIAAIYYWSVIYYSAELIMFDNIFSLFFGMMEETIKLLLVLLRLLFIFDKFIKSEKFCSISVYSMWGLFTILMIIAFSLNTSIEVWYVYLLFLISDYISLITLLILTIKCVVYYIRHTGEESYYLRSIITSAFVLLLAIQWFTFLIIDDIHVVTLITKYCLIILYYSNGFINLALLVSYDYFIKRFFYQLFCNNLNYYNVQFVTTESEALHISIPKNQLVINV